MGALRRRKESILSAKLPTPAPTSASRPVAPPGPPGKTRQDVEVAVLTALGKAVQMICDEYNLRVDSAEFSWTRMENVVAGHPKFTVRKVTMRSTVTSIVRER